MANKLDKVSLECLLIVREAWVNGTVDGNGRFFVDTVFFGNVDIRWGKCAGEGIAFYF